MGAREARAAKRVALRFVAAAVCATLLNLASGTVRAEQSLADTVARLKPSIVAVGTFMKTRSPPFAFLGTGFVVDDGTLIATCAHVVPDTPKSEAGAVLTVVVGVAGTSEPQPREVTAVVLDVEHDLALLRIAGAPLPALKFGNSESVREGQSIAFTGFPLGPVLGFHAVTHTGIVASLPPVTLPARNAKQLEGQQIERLRAGPVTLFQLDATVFSGNSGSPVYDPNTGEVLAVVSMGFLRGIKDPVLGQPANISFAVPTKYLRELIARIPR